MTSAVSRRLLPILTVVVAALTLVGCAGTSTAGGASARPSASPTQTTSAEDAAFTAEIAARLPEADMDTLIPMVHQLCEDLYDDDKGYLLGYGVFNDKIREQYGDEAVEIIVPPAVETYCPGDEPKMVEAFKKQMAEEFPDVDLAESLAISRAFCADLESMSIEKSVDRFITTAESFLTSESASAIIGMAPTAFCPEKTDAVIAYLRTL